MSIMQQEAQETSAIIEQQLSNIDEIKKFTQAFITQPPQYIMTLARGSSYYAAEYFAYLIMSQLGIFSAAIPLSLFSLYQAPFKFSRAWCIAFSQSGQSPDLIHALKTIQQLRTTTIAITNTPLSPLTHYAHYVLDVFAGNETAVAATKSFIAMLTRSAQYVAYLQKDRALLNALVHLPKDLQRASEIKWEKALHTLRNVEKMMIVSRGIGLSIAQEAALKLKEVANIQAEAFSSTEIQHGPREIIHADYPILVFAMDGIEQNSILNDIKILQQQGANLLIAAPAHLKEAQLPIVNTHHPLLNPISLIQSFYWFVAELAKMKGLNPNQPRFLSKITKTF